jgi:plasmid stabilization system protein ParE
MPALLIRPAAEMDMLLATEWYETRAAGLGTDFLRAADVCFGLIQRMPQAYQLVARDVRRARLRRFPFSVYFLATSQRIVILAVLHARRDPREWQSRL